MPALGFGVQGSGSGAISGGHAAQCRSSGLSSGAVQRTERSEAPSFALIIIRLHLDNASVWRLHVLRLDRQA